MQTLTAHMPSGMSTIVWSETDKPDSDNFAEIVVNLF